MKVWLWILGIIGLAWSGIWFAGAYGTERVMGAWLEARANEGWLVNYRSLETAGYPMAFRTTLTEVELADPETGWAWIAPRFEITQPSYKPHRIEAVWPAEQTLASPFERLDITSGAMEAVVQVRPGGDLALDQSRVTLAEMVMSSTEGWQMALADATFQMMREDGAESSYEILFEANSLTPPAPLQAVLNPAGILPDAMEQMRFDAVMGFDRPWDLSALEQSRPGITRIDLADLSANWGDLSLRLAGSMDVDAEGYPTGEISVRAQNWREMVEMGVNAGAIPAETRGGIERVLALVAGLSGRESDIDAPLSFRNQRVFFGPIPIGTAPQLVLR
ncbi:DUF2125 domain-containing protein [Rhodophyticola porphyridii]|uniref:DUF2125 domain-containing protein n=1 Tax=Rhodophyticola porphyridii TaxID=1852017 RepID=A0A3L9YMY9_9RHOB|nr:DUF2125 domain-containing protein [Rhodophyticola porphyridii]RMA44070.1 DUF2125 domain-containing protein [Rhodophyticola porphyridii]